MNFLDRVSRKSSNIKCNQNPTTGSQVFHTDEETDGYEKANSLKIRPRLFPNVLYTTQQTEKWAKDICMYFKKTHTQHFGTPKNFQSFRQRLKISNTCTRRHLEI